LTDLANTNRLQPRLFEKKLTMINKEELLLKKIDNSKKIPAGCSRDSHSSRRRRIGQEELRVDFNNWQIEQAIYTTKLKLKLKS